MEVDARTSDAIALAVRFNCPIYTYEFILSQAGILIEGNEFVFLENVEGKEDSPNVSSPGVSSYASLSDDELRVQLKAALEEEAYEKAAKIRDELSRRKAS
ncbi:hypothetical protein D3C78_1691390 [compost metagenome]